MRRKAKRGVKWRERAKGGKGVKKKWRKRSVWGGLRKKKETILS